MNVRARPCGINECQEVVEFKRAHGMFHELLDRVDLYRRRLEHDPWSILVVKQTALVGVLFVFFDPSITKLTDLVVVPEQRRYGIGRVLISTAETHVRARGGELINAYVEEGNQASLGLMGSLGFDLHTSLHVRVPYKLL